MIKRCQEKWVYKYINHHYYFDNLSEVQAFLPFHLNYKDLHRNPAMTTGKD
jgi:hypothetical protein